MEISLLSPDAIKIKGKKASFIIDPYNLKTKEEASAVIFLVKGQNQASDKVSDYRVSIDGPGDFEVGGVKLEVIQIQDKLKYDLFLDGGKISVFCASSLKSLTDLDESGIIIVKEDEKIDESALSSLSPKLIVLYGQNQLDGDGQLLGKKVEKTRKVNIKPEKLPDEPEVYELT